MRETTPSSVHLSSLQRSASLMHTNQTNALHYLFHSGILAPPPPRTMKRPAAAVVCAACSKAASSSSYSEREKLVLALGPRRRTCGQEGRTARFSLSFRRTPRSATTSPNNTAEEGSNPNQQQLAAERSSSGMQPQVPSAHQRAVVGARGRRLLVEEPEVHVLAAGDAQAGLPAPDDWRIGGGKGREKRGCGAFVSRWW